MTDAPKTTATDEASEASRRDRDLAELGDYVRLLASRMGLKDWTFEVIQDPPDDDPTLVILRDIRYRLDRDVGRAAVHVSGDFFEHTPEERRYCLVTCLLECHFAYLPECERLRLEGGHLEVAAAWAPCLPLPLVGLMRRAGGAKGEGER